MSLDAVPAPEPRAAPAGATDELPSVNTLFEQPWWLEAVAPGRWDAVTCRRGDAVVARLPYVVRPRGPFTILSHPPLTPRLGPWLQPSEGKPYSALSWQKELMEELIGGLPRFDHFYAQFSPEVMNWLPFYWAGFSATVRYTYRFDDLSDLEALWRAAESKVRRRITLSHERLEVRWDADLEALIELNRATYARQGIALPYPDELLRRIDAACTARRARRIVAAVDAAGQVHAVMYAVWDAGALYLLASAQNREARGSAAPTMLTWELIRFAASVSRRFDFEASMIPSIEQFKRPFGARLTPYLAVTKAGPRLAPLIAGRDLLTTLTNPTRVGRASR